MSVKGRAFCPSQDTDLVLRHMQSHYRKVAEATAKVDTSIPKSLLNSIKVKERTRRRSSKKLTSSSFTENSRKVFERKCLSQSVPSGQQYDSRLMNVANTSTGNVQSLQCQKPSPRAVVGVTPICESVSKSDRLQNEEKSPSVESSDRLDTGRVRYFNLLELSSNIQEQCVGKWQLYHTPTGRLTRHLTEKQVHTSAQPEKAKPWRPSFHTSSPILKSTCVKPLGSLHNHKSISHSDLPNCTAIRQSPENQTLLHGVPQEENNCWRTGNKTDQNSSELAMGQSPVSSPAARNVFVSGSGVRDSRPMTQNEDPPPQSGNANSNAGIGADSTLCYSKVKELLTEGAEMKHKAQAVARKVTETRQRCKDRMLEHRYLQFESEVTRDIMSHGILSEPALDLLFRVHIDRHKHQLREDELVKRLEVLKRLIIGV